MSREIVFDASPTVSDFITDNSFWTGIMGPYGSGKSVGCVMKIYKKASEQAPDADGVRRTMCVVVRDTYKNLMQTTWRTIKHWFPPGVCGVWRSTEKVYYLGGIATKDGVVPGAIKLADGTKVFCEIMLLALDDESDAERLQSLEPSFAWVNEYRNIKTGLMYDLGMRVGRYPENCTWFGVMMDTNPPPFNGPHYKFFEEFDHEKAKEMAKEWGVGEIGAALYKQPGGLDPNAENIEHLPGGRQYYLRLLATSTSEGKSQGWINAHIHGKYAYYSDAEGLYSDDFSDSMHIARQALHPDPKDVMLIGLDPGFAAGAAFMQRDKYARWQVFAELVENNVDAKQFSHYMKELIKEMGWDRMRFLIVGDPFLRNRSSANRTSWEDVLKREGWPVMIGTQQGLDPRIQSVRAAMRRTNAGIPSFLLDAQRCPTLKRACMGAYHRAKVKGKDQHRDQPEKNDESHIAEAIQYPISTFDWDMVNGGTLKRIPTAKARYFSDIGKGRRPTQPSQAGDWKPW
jgi:hypothetical protein